MALLTYSQTAFAAASRSIILTGCARSGTTLIGKLIATARNLEYFFEPESLVSLYAFSSLLSEEAYKNLYCAMLVEHLCAGSLTGRILNFNSNDDSYVENMKDHQEVQHRISKSWRRDDVSLLLEKIGPVFKIPSILPLIPSCHHVCFPESKIVCVLRDPVSVYRSIKIKQWFTERADVLAPYWTNNHSPYSLRPTAPYWVHEEDLHKWSRMNEVQKFVYYYQLIYRAALASVDRLTIIEYNRLIARPKVTIDSLFGDLNLSPSAMTDNVLSSITERQRVSKDLSFEELSGVDSVMPLYQELLTYSL